MTEQHDIPNPIEGDVQNCPGCSSTKMHLTGEARRSHQNPLNGGNLQVAVTVQCDDCDDEWEFLFANSGGTVIIYRATLY